VEKKVMNKAYMLENRDEILAKYATPVKRFQKPVLLTKKEKKVLGIGKDEGRAIAKYVRLSQRKANIVIKLIKDKGIDEAYAILQYTPKAVSAILLKLLKSAESNAVNNNELSRDLLYVADCFASQGPTLKRMLPRARGSASRILKRTSHITIVLKERK
jgi:large subunit ribosomal protein L22